MIEPRRKLVALLLVVVAGLWPGPAGAQLSGTLVPSTGETLSLELNQGHLVRLDTPAASVFVANPAIADINVRSARLVYLFGRAPGQTSLFALDRDDNVIANLEVVVSHNLARLEEALDTLLPAGGISVSSIDGGIVLSGAVATASDAENARRLATRFIAEGEEVINQLAVTEPNQVNLRVRVAEVSREVINQFGFDWAQLEFSGRFILGLTTGLTNFAPTSTLEGTYGRGDFDVNGFIDALARDGLVTVLAEPNLTALSGETASFLAGGEFPIPISQEDGEVTVEFREFGVSLSFTPTIVGDNRINLRVRPEVSQLSDVRAVRLEDFDIPALSTRRAETTVELASGQSFAIAGLLQDNSEESIDRTPGLGDLPILGALFKSESFQRNETELVIIVTPYLVRPVSTELPLPTDPYIGTRSNGGAAGQAARPAALSKTIPIPTTAASAAGPAASAGYILD
ncbi:MAG: type II and III secretion system protein family protein [Kiloniellaceae bacterium]